MIRIVIILPFLIAEVLIFGTTTKAQNHKQNEAFEEMFKLITTFQKQVRKTGWTKLPNQQSNLPRLVKKYTDDNNSWWHIYNINHTYDFNSRLIYSMETNVPDNSNSKKDTLIYNSQGKLTQKITNVWQEDMWVDFERINITYNSNGYKTMELIESYNIDTWDTAFFEVMNFENNQISGYYSFMGFMEMKIELQIDFIYNGSNVLQEMIFSTTDFETGELVYFQKLTDLTFESYTGNYEEDKIENAEIDMWNNEWIYFGRFETIYDELGGFTRLYKMYNGSTYENFQLETEVYDVQSNLIESKTEIWENEAWLIDQGEKNTRLYENGNQIECVFQTWDPDAISYANLNKEEYEDFIILGIANSLNPEIKLAFLIFPNPANEEVNISFEENIQSIMSIELFDILGKAYLINSYSIDCDNIILDLRSIKEGYYFLKITTPFSSQTKKLIIEGK